MASHVEGRLLRRSIPFVESWLAELTASASPAASPAAAPAANGGKPKGSGRAGAAASAPAATGPEPTPMSRCCFAVGKVVEVSRHPDSTKLYVEKIDMGPELNALTGGEPRMILSGLQGYVKEEDFLNRLVLVIANLKPRNIAGLVSNGMVLCASHAKDPNSTAAADPAEELFVLLDIPEGTAVGERVVFDGHDMPYEPVLNKKLSKHFEEVMTEVKTNEKGEVCWRGQPFRTSRGVITASLANARIS